MTPSYNELHGNIVGRTIRGATLSGLKQELKGGVIQASEADVASLDQVQTVAKLYDKNMRNTGCVVVECVPSGFSLRVNPDEDAFE